MPFIIYFYSLPLITFLVYMDILEKTQKILMQPVCDSCLGRQFAQLLSGYTNGERGKILRTIAAMSIDKEKHSTDMDVSNFAGYTFHNLETAAQSPGTCTVCSGLFGGMEKWAKKILSKAKNVEFSSFLMGTKLSFDLITKEEGLWERVGIDYCEPIKAEINREIGKLVEKGTGAKFDPKNPDVNFIADFESGKVSAELNPVFIYGEYQKLVRGIPQTRWPSGKYKTSIEQIIAKPLMAATKGESHKLHGLGREDIDARCLGWRPFVLEIIKPARRKVDLRKLGRKIEKKVRVRGLRFSNIAEVRKIKESRLDKSYRCFVACDKKISRAGLKKLSSLAGTIEQRTPQRVLHRRSDLKRKRKLVSIKTRLISPKKFLLEARCEAGLYVKELVSGDNGRTRPSISELLQCSCVAKDLDVIAIHRK